MNRLSWDSTTPRRPTAHQDTWAPRPERARRDAEADLRRIALQQPFRITMF
jgi:hypothetical protein